MISVSTEWKFKLKNGILYLNEIWEKKPLKSLDKNIHSMNRKGVFIVEKNTLHIEIPGLK